MVHPVADCERGAPTGHPAVFGALRAPPIGYLADVLSLSRMI